MQFLPIKYLLQELSRIHIREQYLIGHKVLQGFEMTKEVYASMFLSAYYHVRKIDHKNKLIVNIVLPSQLNL